MLFNYEARDPNPVDTIDFTLDDVTKLLEFDDTNGRQKGAKSLLNFENAK